MEQTSPFLNEGIDIIRAGAKLHENKDLCPCLAEIVWQDMDGDGRVFILGVGLDD